LSILDEFWEHHLNEIETSGQNRFGGNNLRVAAALIVVTVLTLFLIRLSGHPLLSRHDERVSGYILDAVQNGNWIVQKDSGGEIASKPPLLTWCASVASLLTGRISRFALYLPAAASLCATALVLLAAGRRMFGWRAGFFAAVAFVLSPAGYTQLAVARYDGVLALMVILAALAAFRAWMSGSGWTWFWLAAAMGTLAKGPLALLLGTAGLLAAFWERRTGTPVPFRGQHYVGVLVFLLITGGWFALAYRELGQPLIDKMIGRELVGHAVGSDDESSPLGLLKPPVDFVLTFAPWSLLALNSFWRVWKRPDADARIRRFERFLVCGFLAGLLVFCLAGHQMGRLIVPLIPFAALLAGRELSDITFPWSNRRIFKTAIVLIALFMIGGFVEAHIMPRRSPRVQETLSARQASRLIAERLGANAPLTHVDSPFAVQFYLNSVRPSVSFERAAELLRGNAAACIVVCDFANLEKALGPGAGPLHEALRWPEAGEPWIRVVGNYPFPITNQPVAMLLGPIRVEAQSLRLDHPRLNYRRGTELDFRDNASQGKLRIENQSDVPQTVRVRIFDEASKSAPTRGERSLQPGEVWEFPGIGPNHGVGTQAK
jgi:4-amino-4-deoxy-L-arabinose transferase-like glycosyltransferase